MAAIAQLEVRGLTKRFGGLVAVKDIGFSVKGGTILGLIGPNGSGKSTVMKLIMGLERPDTGSVLISGVEVAGWPPHRIARLGVGWFSSIRGRCIGRPCWKISFSVCCLTS